MPGRRHRPQKTRAGRRQPWGSREGTHQPPPRSSCIPVGRNRCARGCPCAYGGVRSLYPSSGTAGGTKPARPPRKGSAQGSLSPCLPGEPGKGCSGRAGSAGTSRAGRAAAPNVGCLDGSTPGEGRQGRGCSAPGLKDTEGFGRAAGGIWKVVLAGPFWQGHLAREEQTGKRTEVSWQEGAGKDTLHPTAELGWAKTTVTPVPKDSPSQKTKGCMAASFQKRDAERCL